MLREILGIRFTVFSFILLFIIIFSFVIFGEEDERIAEAGVNDIPLADIHPFKAPPVNVKAFIPLQHNQRSLPLPLIEELISASKRSIEIVQETFMLDTLLGELSHIGILKSKQYFELLSEDDEFYYIEFGYSQGMIFKEDAKLIENHTYLVKEVIDSDDSNSIVTKKPAIIYGLGGDSENEIGVLKANLRYPILQDEGEWYLIEIGGRQGYVNKDDVEIDKGVPAIMYHHFLTEQENKNYIGLSTTISPKTFEEQMRFVQKEGFASISTEELKRYINKETNLPGKAIVITMDDGLKSTAYHAAPILRKLNLKANAYLISSRISDTEVDWDPDSNQVMSVNEVKENEDIFYYHGHTDNLHKIQNGQGKLTIVPYPQVLNDLQTNFSFLKEHGYLTTHFAYPYGHYSEQVFEALEEVGITTAFTTKKGFNQPEDNLYMLKRWNIGPTVDMKKFEEIILN